jgi:serine/threonine protein kinase
MEYVDGTDLRSILRKLKERALRMPIDLAVYVVSKVAAALEHAHQRKDAQGQPAEDRAPRRLAAENILISYDGEVKLTDFASRRPLPRRPPPRRAPCAASSCT